MMEPRLIAKPLENNLRSVEGIKHINTNSSLGVTRVILEFDIQYDMTKALVDVKQSVEEVKSELPNEFEDPQIEEYSESSFPVMTINTS